MKFVSETVSSVSIRFQEEDQQLVVCSSPTETSLVVAMFTVNTSSLVASAGDCRMCFKKQMFANDPVVQLGCECLGENSNVHESCIRKWFPKHSVDTGVIACEICKAQLGEHARSIVKSYISSKVFQHLLRQGMAKLGRTINTIVTAIDEFNHAIEYGCY